MDYLFLALKQQSNCYVHLGKLLSNDVQIKLITVAQVFSKIEAKNVMTKPKEGMEEVLVAGFGIHRSNSPMKYSSFLGNRCAE